jgi:hypothetical protein
MLLWSWGLVKMTVSRRRREVCGIASRAAKRKCIFTTRPKRAFILV